MEETKNIRTLKTKIKLGVINRHGISEDGLPCSDWGLC